MPLFYRHESLVCPNTPVACMFAMAGCTHKVTRKDLQTHLANQTVHHMQLLADKLNKLQQIQQVASDRFFVNLGMTFNSFVFRWDPAQVMARI